MFVPIHDDNPLVRIHFPLVTWALIAANVIVFLVEAGGLPERVIASFAIVPNEIIKVGVLGGPALFRRLLLPVGLVAATGAVLVLFWNWS
mgnify:CR=1 FL=1